MWTQTRDHWILLEMGRCKLVFNEEPMDYLKFEELSKNWDTTNVQHHVTQRWSYPIPFTQDRLLHPRFRHKGRQRRGSEPWHWPKMILDPRLQICWQILFAVKLSARVYEMMVVSKSLTSGQLGIFQLIPHSIIDIPEISGQVDSGTQFDWPWGFNPAIHLDHVWCSICAYPYHSISTHQGAGCVSPLLFSSSRFNCPDKMGDRDMTKDSKPLDTANLMSNMPKTLLAGTVLGRNICLSIHQNHPKIMLNPNDYISPSPDMLRSKVSLRKT